MDLFDRINIDVDSIPRLDAKAQANADRLKADGVNVPHDLAYALQKPIPEPKHLEWGWYAHFWPRPDRRTCPDAPDWQLNRAQEAWDKSEEFVKARLEMRAERDAKKAAEAKAAAEADKARREQEARELKAELRERFMALPGTSEADFEAQYPTLLADHRRQLMQAQATADEQVRAELRSGLARIMASS